MVETYRTIKILGLATFIPVIMAVGPLTGYWTAEFFCGRFGWPFWTVYVGLVLGGGASIIEVARIIRVMRKQG